MSIIEHTVKSLFGSMQLRCPVCDAALDLSSINKHEELALCPACGSLSKLTELIRADSSMTELVNKPPARCTAARIGQDVRVSISLRVIPKFIGYLWEAIFWNALLSMFLIGLLAAYYNIFVGPVPNWVPMTKNGIVIVNGAPVDFKTALCVTLFLTPFTVIGAKFIFEALMRLLGKTSVVIGEHDSYVATGIGAFRWKRRFDVHQVRAVESTNMFWGIESPTSNRLHIEANKSIKFGVYLDHEQMRWMEGILAILLLSNQAGRGSRMTIDDRWQDLQEAIANAKSVKSQPIGQSTQLRTAAESPAKFMHCRACSAAINAESINIKEGVALCDACGELSRLADLQSVYPSNQISNARCPDCAHELSANSINLREGVALCPACGRLAPLSETTRPEPSSQDLMASPPENCSIVPTAQGIEVRLSSRSMPKFIGLTLFAIFWNGIICLVGMQPAIELYELYVGPAPAWIIDLAPNMDADIAGSPLLNLLFLTPFCLIGAFVLLGALDGLFGKQSVIVEQSSGYYLGGFKWLAWKKLFDPNQVRSIEIIDTQWNVENGNNKQICIEANRKIKFGAFLEEEKQRWMVAILRTLLLPTATKPPTSLEERISKMRHHQETI